MPASALCDFGFNTQPPEGGCSPSLPFLSSPTRFQHTAARRRLPISLSMRSLTSEVSTHSRPKAAAAACLCRIAMGDCFNTQPPEGGCKLANWRTALLRGFNTQPPEGGCRQKTLFFCPNGQSFNTQPPEGGCYAEQHLNVTTIEVSTHSRPKAAAWYSHNKRQLLAGFNTQPPEGGCKHALRGALVNLWFQHTAARRRLRAQKTPPHRRCSFNTQPPEGGCHSINDPLYTRWRFQHTAARRRLPVPCKTSFKSANVSTHSRPKAAAAKDLYSSYYLKVSTHSRPKAAAPYLKKQEKSAD